MHLASYGHRRALVALMLMSAAHSPVHAGVVTWDGSCDTLRWAECCQQVKGVSESNWDRGAASSALCAALLLPGPNDDVVIADVPVEVDCCSQASGRTLAAAGDFSIHHGLIEIIFDAGFDGMLICEGATLRSGNYIARGGLQITGLDPLAGLRVEQNARLTLDSDGEQSGLGAITLMGNSTFTIADSATYEIRNDFGILGIPQKDGAPHVEVFGTIAKTSVGDSSIDLPCMADDDACGFDNHGLVNVQSGRLLLSADGTDSGGYQMDAGAELLLGPVSRRFEPGAAFMGEGLLRTDQTQFSVNTGADVHISNLSGYCQFESDGTGVVEIDHTADATGLALTGATLRIGPDALATLATPRIVASRIEVNGELKLAAGGQFQNEGDTPVEIVVHEGAFWTRANMPILITSPRERCRIDESLLRGRFVNSRRARQPLHA